MCTTTITVEGMSCGHCVSSVQEEVGAVAGVTSVDVDLATGAVVVTSEGELDLGAVHAAVEAAGYTVAGPGPVA